MQILTFNVSMHFLESVKMGILYELKRRQWEMLVQKKEGQIRGYWEQKVTKKCKSAERTERRITKYKGCLKMILMKPITLFTNAK